MDPSRTDALALLESAEAAFVSTVDGEGWPQTRAMFNLRNRRQFPDFAPLFEGGGFAVLFTTNTASPKVAAIRVNPKVAVYYCQAGDFQGLTLGGEMEIVSDPELRERLWRPQWEMYYPGGRDDPDHTILRLRPKLVRWYHRLRTVVLPAEAA